MNNTFELKFNKADTSVAGYPFGEKTFKEQVEGKIDYTQDITIIFPDNIKMVASSFIQGFFASIIQNIGLRGVEEFVTIKSSSERLSEKIKKNIR
ncbi:MAG: hypothetical protein MSA72_00550 [Lachnospiraceae bacterium]|nr:hypothetical protein [Lachnospiraceae bacterium]